MHLPFEQILHALVGETYARRNAVFIIFAFISLVFLGVGSIWPKKYTSFTIIHADRSNIIQPLMQGRAETTHTINHISNAREIIFGEKIMSQILKDAGWLEEAPTEIDQEKIKKDIKKRITIEGVGSDLIRIAYIDNDPMRSYVSAKRMADLFIQEGELAQVQESEAAFQFIENQVKEYLAKLTKVEEELMTYRLHNPDAQPGMKSQVAARISSLKKEIEETRLELSEAVIRKNSLTEQLSGEAAITISQSREGQYRSKIADLQAQLETLRLDYKDTYPDILRIKHQIVDLKESMKKEKLRQVDARNKAKNSGSTYIDESIILNPLYQQLRSDASSTETILATLNARINEMEKILKKEFDRATRINDGEASLSKLTRNYKVNQGIYQDLLRRRENARVSRSLDQEQQGLTFKIQEPAKIPLLPTGIRFMHFAAAGLLFGLATPIGLIYIMLQIDPRIRFSRVISSELELPVLAEITRLSSMREERSARINLVLIGIGMVILLATYGYISWLKFSGQI